MSGPTPEIAIPDSIKPVDGRFGSGPSKVRPEAVAALAATGTDYLGTSHRQATVQFVVGSLRNLLAEVLAVPDGYIQRSATLPRFLNPKRFRRWFQRQNIALIMRNN